MPCPSQFDKIYEIDYPDDEKKRIRRRYIDSEINSDSDDYCDRSSEYFMMKNNSDKGEVYRSRYKQMFLVIQKKYLTISIKEWCNYIQFKKQRKAHINQIVKNNNLEWPTKFESGYLYRIKIRGKYSWVDKDIFDYKYYEEYLYNMKIKIIKLIEKNI